MNHEKENLAVGAVDQLKPERVQEGVAATTTAATTTTAGAGSGSPGPSPAPGPAPNPQSKKKSKPSAFADVLREWESLLAAVDAQAPNRTSIEPHRTALADSVDQAKAAKALQETHDTNRQTSTQSLRQILVEGKDRMIRLRGAIKAELGPTTEQLKQFGIRPLRRRLLQKQAPPAPPPTPEIVQGKATGKEGA